MKKQLLTWMGGGTYVLTTTLLLMTGFANMTAWGQAMTNAPSQVEQTDAAIISLNRSSMSTDILYDRVTPLADLGAFTGVPGAEVSQSEHFFQSYYELYNARYNRGSMVNNEQLHNQVAASYGGNSYPIGIIYYNYDEVRRTAVQENLLRYENGSFYDVPGRPRGPFQLQRAVVASPLLHENAHLYKPGWLTFRLDPAFFLTNTGTSLQYCQIDFGDGAGLRTIFPNNSVQVYYGSPGQRNLDIRIFTTNGQQSQAYASVTVVESTFDDIPYANRNGDNICNETPVSFAITGDAFNPSQYPSGGATYGAKGTATIFFARGNCASKVLRKPVIFLDGFDPTNNRDYKAIYRDYINDEDQDRGGSNLKLGDKFRNEGYDIVVLDYEDSGDYIERNGLMVQKLLQELWSRYSSTIEQDFVVIGPSMGALVGQYALADAERRGINHHTRLYISFDGPHRGANIPIGLQQMIGYGLRSKLAEPSQGNRCRPGTSGVVEDDFPLNIRSAKQMLLHHYLAYSETPAPHPYRNIFVQNMNNVGYPNNCRKIALINGSRRGINQRAGPSSTNLNRDLQASEDILRLVVQSKAANFGLTNDKTILAWGSTTAPINNRGNTFHAFTSSLVKKLLGVDDKIYDDYARPYNFAPDKSLDLIPGGHSNTMEEIIRVVNTQKEVSAPVGCIYLGRINTGYFDFNFLFDLSIILRQGRNFFATSNTPVHSFVPTVSAVDFNNQNTLSYNFDNENLKCSGKTPFDHVYAPAENQAHVAITPENGIWFENEIKIQNIPAGCGGTCDFSITANSAIAIGTATGYADRYL